MQQKLTVLVKHGAELISCVAVHDIAIYKSLWVQGFCGISIWKMKISCVHALIT